MALDFMPPEAMGELWRILNPGAHAFVNLHHPTIIPSDLDSQITKFNRKAMHKMVHGKELTLREVLTKLVLIHKAYLRDNNKLFQTEQQIVAAFCSYGFTVERVALGGSPIHDRWWEVDLFKPRED